MQRREFSMATASVAAAASLGALSIPAQAQGPAPRAGTDFLVLDKPAPVEAPAGKVEVVEFFWYSCPHCNTFEPALDEWIKKAPKDVVVRRVPIAFRADFEPQQRLYYVLEAMNKVDELHKKVFYAIHVEKQTLKTPELIADWAEKQGLNKAKFLETYNSFSVATKARKATQLQDAYKIDGVPALGVAGRYFTSGSMAQTMGRALLVTDYLIAQVRKG
ncbi:MULTISPECIES: thiol:disulfide interchange protein DsbA/DsbL [unclassified Polaromonas]|uniref:thiol:disulfide interchange protein DsbA/DsbL n=1 Tax=unclassified Polaromonas TaxID=2638319 RepID=UPI000BCAE7A9|nr:MULTISPECIES: thiol:disulfide interchange protein DsbA/DsbL [unclassified Polaromonas]OYY33993.1 MAG: disulfide bond formation protein DsbA [Polaromonas sp. 35-63-35]OYZ20814.1 MAG: disulfide bond formation protein DsbA [Polaromonas sp. 16-63-31]OYZ78406.1 MAG: disulfide bond formation protein DsbA [Polaromonas sp. 24-63-21]OZA49159.1 MAG: disulfide bond formation protein DsbA [Polaromonas sp. 17-63-33]OZA85913.1 MAG: disulfide bond formation protein DsbA [Polaromonas sp. 39-63-25]